MAARSKKKTPPYAKGGGGGGGGGDSRASPSTGRAVTSRFNSTPPLHFEGIYHNRRMVHIMTSLIGCEVEVELVKDRVIYTGILRTVSPHMDFVIELASPKPPPGQVLSKSAISQTMVVKWDDIARVTATEDINSTSQKEIFKIDTDISTTSTANHINGHGEKRKELERFQFDDSSPLKDLDDDTGKGWTAEEMFVTNEEKFNVSSTYDPDMSEYTTPLVLTDSDQSRIQKAERKAREIESSLHDGLESECSRGDERNEEDLYSSVVREDVQPMKVEGKENEEEQTARAKDIQAVTVEPTDTAQINGDKVEEAEGKIREEDKREKTEETKDDKDTESTELVEAKEPSLPSPSSSRPSSSEVASPSADTDSTGKEPKATAPRPFKLNPDAQEFKPAVVQPATSSRYSRQPKGNGQRVNQQLQQRSTMYTPQDQAALYGVGAAYMANATPTIRLMQGQPTAGPLASPTGLMLRPMHGSQLMGHQGNQFYSIPTSLPGTPNHGTFNQAALLGHPGPHGLGMAATAPQGNVVYVPLPYGQHFLPTGPIAGSNILSYTQPQGGGTGK